MTMDNTIIVDQDFNPNKKEDQALYAHEHIHKSTESSSVRQHTVRDAEEIAARAAESMVLHRRARGEDFSDIMRDVAHRKKDVASDHKTSDAGRDAGDDQDKEDIKQQALMTIERSGKDNFLVVEDISRFIQDHMDRREHLEGFRGAHTEFYPLEY